MGLRRHAAIGILLGQDRYPQIQACRDLGETQKPTTPVALTPDYCQFISLYQAPIESSVASKAATDKSLTQAARSSIRRRPRVRERRSRILLDADSYRPAVGESTRQDTRPTPADLAHMSNTTTIYGPNGVTMHVRMLHRDSETDEASSLTPDRLAQLRTRSEAEAPSLMAERRSRLDHAATHSPAPEGGGPNANNNNGNHASDTFQPANLVDLEYVGRRRLEAPRESYPFSSLRSTLASERRQQQHSDAARRLSEPHRRLRDTENNLSDRFSAWDGSVPAGSRNETGDANGLGDRERSLSLEPNDNVWGRLLTTLTPDPQPPSVGSSFAYTSASATASQGQVRTDSSSTARTTSGETEGSAVESAQASGCDNTDSDGDGEDARLRSQVLDRVLRRGTARRNRRRSYQPGDDQVQPGTAADAASPRYLGRGSSNASATATHGLGSLRPAASTSRGGRSYADVTRSNRSSNSNADEGSRSEDLELFGGIAGIQRIVRNLTNRTDITDEWWAEVGLSRTLSQRDF